MSAYSRSMPTFIYYIVLTVPIAKSSLFIMESSRIMLKLPHIIWCFCTHYKCLSSRWFHKYQMLVLANDKRSCLTVVCLQGIVSLCGGLAIPMHMRSLFSSSGISCILALFLLFRNYYITRIVLVSENCRKSCSKCCF